MVLALHQSQISACTVVITQNNITPHLSTTANVFTSNGLPLLAKYLRLQYSLRSIVWGLGGVNLFCLTPLMRLEGMDMVFLHMTIMNMKILYCLQGTIVVFL